MAQGTVRKPPRHAMKTAQQSVERGPKLKKDIKRLKGKKDSGWGQDIVNAVKKYGKSVKEFYGTVGKGVLEQVKKGKKSATAAVKEAFESKPIAPKDTIMGGKKKQWDKPNIVEPNPTSKMAKRKKHIQGIMDKLESPRKKRKE